MTHSDKVPVVIGFSLPFQLVLRDEDSWNPTDAEIATRSYDYVRLHRLSTYLDVGIRPYSLAVGFDGSLLLPALGLFHDRYAVSEKFNEVLGKLLLGGHYSEAVAPEDVIFGTLSFDGYYDAVSFGDGPIASFHMAIQTTYISPLDIVKLVSPRTVKASDLLTAFEKGCDVTSKVPRMSPSIFLAGITHFSKHQWADALVSLWTCIEQVVAHVWDAEVVLRRSSGTEIPGRRDFLNDHRTWPASTRIEVLYQNSLVGNDEYSLLNAARKSRNDFVHNGVKPAQPAVESALRGLFRLLSLCATEFKDAHFLDASVNLIEEHKRGDILPKKSRLSIDDVSHWMPKKAIPGDAEWGDKEYEKIPALELQPVEPGSNKMRTH